jgi:zinc and cadmium transporter
MESGSLIVWIVVFTSLGGVLGVLLAGTFLLLPEHVRSRLLPSFVSLAIGALLGAAFLALIPHALEDGAGVNVHEIGLTVLLGLLGFFTLEKMVLWRHCHTHDCELHGSEFERAKQAATGSLILIGDGIHNFVDGVLIAAAFLTDVHLGIVTSIAVIAHEIPQEIGDFAILLHSGYSRNRALFYNVLSSLTTVVGGIGAYYSLTLVSAAVPYVLAVAASSFIYVAVADLIPGLHRRPAPKETLQQIVLILTGVAIIYLTDATMH